MDIEKQKNIIKTLYIFLIISIISSFIPMILPQVLSVVLIFIVLISAYFYKYKNNNDDGILSNHMVYMIGTIWISGGFLLLGMAAAAGIVYTYGDHTIIHDSMGKITSGVMMDEHGISSIKMDYMYANQTILILASIPTIFPAIAYFIYRIINGYGRAVKGYRISKPKGWF